MQIVITTIFPPTPGAAAIAKSLEERGGILWVIGDRSGPRDYQLPATRFYDIARQSELAFSLAKSLPERHYARKNLGYLLAAQSGASFLVETDDDNLPLPGFWEPRSPILSGRRAQAQGWLNVYALFSSSRIWPRGFPLECVNAPLPETGTNSESRECLIQQGLANKNPDVDAVYRFIMPLPIDFADGPSVLLDSGCWCPFNSQNTTWFKPAFPLLYLPSHCTFRMTDIWRSFVAQRCLWEMDSCLGFTRATIYQERNEHNLLRDFQQEIPGYLNNDAIRQTLEGLPLQQGRECHTVCANVRQCYLALVAKGFIPAPELGLLELWIRDVSALV